jgi:type IV pilus assembly protein PilF
VTAFAVWQRWALWGAIISVTAFFWGCASADRTKASQTGVGGADLVTESDEPDARKRARLRVELATGYFEQGQTTVALDEVKQALAADASYAPAHNLRGLAYMRLGEMRLAEESFRRAVTLAPKDANLSHNLGWLLCQQARFSEAQPLFDAALASPLYGGRAKTLLTQGICLAKAGKPVDAESSLSKAFELDAGNPVISFNLAQLLFNRGELNKAQFHLRRLNNSELANAETFWLGMKVEQRLGNRDALRQLGDQLKRRYPQSRELGFYERGAFHE